MQSRQQNGTNALSSQKPPSPLRRVLNIIKEPMFLLLITAGLVSLVLAEPLDASALLLMVFSNLMLNFTNRSQNPDMVTTLIKRKNPSALWISGLTLGLITLVMTITPIREAFGLGETSINDWLISAGLGVASVLWFEIYKLNLKLRGPLASLTHD